MDFSFTEDQEALRELARKIFDDHCTHERLKAVEADAGVVRPHAVGRAGRRRTCSAWRCRRTSAAAGSASSSSCILLEEVGRAVAPVPLWPTLVLGALPINLFGSDGAAQAAACRASRAATSILTAALVETGCDEPGVGRPRRRRATAASGGSTAPRRCVPAAHLAARVLVPARTGDGAAGVFLVDPHAAGVRLERQVTTNGEPQFELTLSGATVGADDVLGDPAGGGAIVDWTLQRAVAGAVRASASASPTAPCA